MPLSPSGPSITIRDVLVEDWVCLTQRSHVRIPMYNTQISGEQNLSELNRTSELSLNYKTPNHRMQMWCTSYKRESNQHIRCSVWNMEHGWAQHMSGRITLTRCNETETAFLRHRHRHRLMTILYGLALQWIKLLDTTRSVVYHTSELVVWLYECETLLTVSSTNRVCVLRYAFPLDQFQV